MTGIRRHRRLLDSQLFWLSFFLFVGTAAGTIFCNHMSMEMKNTLEQWFAGILGACGAVVGGLLQPVRRCPEEALCVDPGGDPDLPDVCVRDHLLCIGSLRIVSGGSDRLCPDDAQRIQRDSALFRAGLSTGDLLCTGGVSLVDRGPGTGAGE